MREKIHYYKNTVLFCFVVILLFFLAGCANDTTNDSNANTVGQQTEAMAQELPVAEKNHAALLLHYGIELPVSRTKIYVNQAGYKASGSKMVLFCGDMEGKTFRVVRKSDRKTVYTGVISPMETDAMSGASLCFGDFTQMMDQGNYYIEADVVGQSYPFSIAEDAYETFFIGLMRNVSDAQFAQTAKGVCDVSLGMHILMYSIQRNGTLYEEAYKYISAENAEKNLIVQLLYMIDWLMEQQGSDGSLYGDYEATAAFCGITAMSREFFGSNETIVSKELLDAAKQAWSWLREQSCESKEYKAARFYAAVQLSKTDNAEEYQTIVNSFLERRLEDYTKNRFIFYGILAYLSAEKNTDRDLCTYIMMCLVDKTEQICIGAADDAWFGTGARTIEDSLLNILLLGFINDVTPSKEYTQIIENTIQYIGGQNETGNCYVNAEGIWLAAENTQGRNLEWNGILLFGVSNMLMNLSNSTAVGTAQ